MEDHFGPGGPIIGLLMLMLWLVPLAVMLWAAMRPTAQAVERPATPPQPTAMELLRQRYVLGEIDAMTFEEMLEHVMASELWEQRGYTRRLPRSQPPADTRLTEA